MGRPDWTSTSAKWAAVAVLGAISAVGIGWSILRDLRPIPPRERASTALRTVDAAGPPAPRAAPSTEPAEAASAGIAAVRINPNTASKAELELLPRVGPALADRIIAERQRSPFTKLEDLGRVRGIGPKTIELLKDHLVFDQGP